MPATKNLEEKDQFQEVYNIVKMKKEEIRLEQTDNQLRN